MTRRGRDMTGSTRSSVVSSRTDERVALDASAAERADEAPKVVDKELRADDLRSAPGRANDRRDREPPSLTLKLRHPSEDFPHGISIRLPPEPSGKCAYRRRSEGLTCSRVPPSAT